MKQQRWRRWWWAARLAAAGVSVLALWLVLRRLDLAALRATFFTMRLRWYFTAHAAFGLGLLGAGIRWHLMLRLNHEAVVHGAASVRMVFISQFFNTLFGGPSSGDIPKTALYSHWFGVPAADVLAASVLDRLVATLGGLIFATAALSVGATVGAFDFVNRWRWVFPSRLFWAVFLGLIALGTGIGVWTWRRPESFLGRSFQSLRRSSIHLLSCSRRSGQALMCAVLTACLFNVTQVLCLQAVTPQPVPWLKLFWLFHAVTAIASLPVTVAGTGLREGASMFLLGQYGVAATTSVAAAMLTFSIHLFWALLGVVLLFRDTRLRRHPRPWPAPQSISVVVPVIDESRTLTETVNHVRAIPEVCEIIVVDGGSRDGTVERATELGCRVLRAPRGRGAQLRAGALAAKGDIIILVHADTWLPVDAGQAVLRCFRDKLVVGGGFWKRFQRPPLIMRGSRIRCWLRLWWNGTVLGDQALFVLKPALESVGGVPDQPLMEEIELCRRLRRLGRLALAGAAVSTSERRFREHGILRTYWRMWRVSWAYRRGVSPEELARRYERR